MTTSKARQPKGVPTGGQFAATNHGEPAIELGPSDLKEPESRLDVAPGAAGELAGRLAAGGLAGKLTPYAGTNPDAGENPLAYTSPSGRELIVSTSDEEGFKVMHDDRYDEDTFSLELGPNEADAAACAETVRDALWQLAINDAAAEATNLSSGDFYELREITVDRAAGGGLVGEISASNDDEMWTNIRHDLRSGTTTVYRDGEQLEGFAADMELAAVFEGLHSEPDTGDFNSHTHDVFTTILRAAAEDQDAPAWAKDAAS